MTTQKNKIVTFFHCGKCLDEKPHNISPRDWNRTETGFTPKGLQVWCVRHEISVVAFDFLSQKIGYDVDGQPSLNKELLS